MTGETPARSRRRLGVGAAIVLVVAVVALTVAIGLIRGVGAPAQQVPLGTRASEAPGVSEAPGAGAADISAPTLYVHVSGAVTVPGLYRFDDGARVVDAIAAAGGFAEGADEASVNLARLIGDGEQLHVPLLGEVSTAAGGAAPAPGAGTLPDGRVNLNTADESALDTLPRIGPALAERIIAWRDENGRFTSVEDLLAVPGIGDKMLEALRDLVTV